MSTQAFEIQQFDEIDSTNTYLVSQARKGARDGLVAVAKYQTSGRGRLDRTWEAPPDASLLASILFRSQLTEEYFYLTSVAVALSARAAIASLVDVVPSLKWPNDLLFADKKVAGVLAELADDPGQERPAVVVGIGINVTWPGPPGVGGTSILEASGIEVRPSAVLDELLAELIHRKGLLDSEDGRRELRREFESSLATIGTSVRIEKSHGELVGTAIGVSDRGHLLVDADGSIHEIVAGDVIHVRPHL
jgi:BirA family transcriptional regulator, biotin operon repressor / biotin---[acetyl-CoA-carboxylase] ligase